MATKLSWTLRSPGWRLAFKALIFGLLLYFFYLDPSWWRALIFLIFTFWAYSQPLFNFLALLPIFLVILILSFWLVWLPLAYQLPVVLILAAGFAVLLGAKNLILTHRQSWLYGLAIFFSYGLILNFFLLDQGGLFWLQWLLTILLLLLLFKNVFGEWLLAVAAALLLGEFLWVAAWLPIGFFSSSNLVFLVSLLLLQSFHQERLRWRDLGLFALLTLIVLVSSYWTI